MLSRIFYNLSEIAIFLSCTSVLQTVPLNLFTDIVSRVIPELLSNCLQAKKKGVLNCFGFPPYEDPKGHPVLQDVCPIKTAVGRKFCSKN